MLPENTDAPENAFFMCYDDPISKEEFLEKFDRDRESKIERLNRKVKHEIDWADGIRWIYVRADTIMNDILKKRKEELGVVKSSQDKTINELEECRVILATLASLAADNKLLDY